MCIGQTSLNRLHSIFNYGLLYSTMHIMELKSNNLLLNYQNYFDYYTEYKDNLWNNLELLSFLHFVFHNRIYFKISQAMGPKYNLQFLTNALVCVLLAANSATRIPLEATRLSYAL